MGLEMGISSSFGVKGIADIEVTMKVNLESEITESKSEQQKHKETYTLYIPPHKKLTDYLEISEQTQKVPFKGKLYVEGNVGVYFENKISNAYGDDSTDHHYKWFPSAKQIVEWAKENGYKNWNIDDDGRAYSVMEGESEITVFSSKKGTGKLVPVE
ncbi:unnamed protein product [Adineta steineri]|uniref:Uncharacterized protein n=1 Tax=Adineta steineri TaxID=433720 RepID=A0A820KE32_9BILA|nr:unnamed protein product [Adineta steineri]